MIVVGIIGGIASGKSSVAAYFEQLGAIRIDADGIGHDVLRLEPVKRAIREQWGSSVFDGAGEVDRARMAKSVFGSDDSSRERLHRLEEITHPRIAERMRNEIERVRRTSTAPMVILDAAVLIKAGWDRFCDKIIFVEADRETRRRRAIGRGWSEREWMQREARQTPEDDMRRVSDAIIDNTSTPEQTLHRVRDLWRRWGLPDSSGPGRQH